MTVYVANAFSLQMLQAPDAGLAKITVMPLPVMEVANRLHDYESSGAHIVSCVGHADTAAVYSDQLMRRVPVQRTSVRLTRGDVLYVGQIVGGRLPEGSTTLPDGVSIEWMQVVVRYRADNRQCPRTTAPVRICECGTSCGPAGTVCACLTTTY